ncbi:hypothetical protein Q3G72_006246 [Acer saccharum]|nr:hypothetical protein Q3G72_006246 [Acer saccharum]
MFYLSLKNKTCTAILKEAFRSKSAIPSHPLLNVRKRYIKLMKQSGRILKSRWVTNRSVDQPNVVKDLDPDYEEDCKGGGAMAD